MTFRIFLFFPNRNYKLVIFNTTVSNFVGIAIYTIFRMHNRLVENMKLKFINICTNTFLIFICFQKNSVV